MKPVYATLAYVLVCLASPAFFAISWTERWAGDGPETFNDYVVAIGLTPLAMVGVPFVPVLRFATFLMDQGV